MGKTIRKGVFETNSSSTHSVTIMSAEDHAKWSDEWLYDSDKEELVSKEEALSEIASKYNISPEEAESIRKDDPYDYPQSSAEFFEDNWPLETDVNSYTTKSGDEIVIICKYGQDN